MGIFNNIKDKHIIVANTLYGLSGAERYNVACKYANDYTEGAWRC